MVRGIHRVRALTKLPTRVRARLSRSGIARWRGAPVVRGSGFSVRTFLRRLPKVSDEVVFQVTDIHALRALAVPTRLHGRRAAALAVRVLYWDRPEPGWVGHLHSRAGVASYDVHYPTELEKHMTVTIRFAGPVDLSLAAQTIYPLLAPDRRIHGSGFPKTIALPGVPVSALRVLPTATPNLSRPYHGGLVGVGLKRGEIGLIGNATPESEVGWARHTYRVDRIGHLSAEPRDEWPLLDLHLHNPVGRTQIFVDGAKQCRVTAIDDRQILVGRGADDEESESRTFSLPVAVALEFSHVRALRSVESLDFSGVVLEPDQWAQLTPRLAEIAATGTVIHGLTRPPADVVERLGAGLVDLMCAGYRPADGLARDLRSVTQRRLAMLRHGGFFELSRRASADHGYRLLPRVSVIISSQRPERIGSVLAQMAAQTYAEFEVVVVMHGVGMPDVGKLRAEGLGDRLTVFAVGPDHLFGEALAAAVRRSSGDLIVKVDDDDIYGTEFLTDLVLAYVFSSADLVGKTTEYLWFEDINQTVHRRFAVEKYHHQAAGGAMMLSRSTYESIGGWRPTPHSVDRSILIGLYEQGGSVYRTQSLGYVYVRHGDGHTWSQSQADLTKHAYEQFVGLPQEIVTIDLPRALELTGSDAPTPLHSAAAALAAGEEPEPALEI